MGSLHQPPAQEKKGWLDVSIEVAVGTWVACDSVDQALTCRWVLACHSPADALVLAGNKTVSITGVSCVPSETVTALGTSTSTIFSPARSEMRSWGVSSMSWSPCRALESSFSCTVVLTGRFDTLVRCSTAHFPHSGQALGLAWQVCDSESDKRTARRVTVRSLSRWLWSSKFVRVLITHCSLSARHTQVCSALVTHRSLRTARHLPLFVPLFPS